MKLLILTLLFSGYSFATTKVSGSKCIAHLQSVVASPISSNLANENNDYNVMYKAIDKILKDSEKRNSYYSHRGASGDIFFHRKRMKRISELSKEFELSPEEQQILYTIEFLGNDEIATKKFIKHLEDEVRFKEPNKINIPNYVKNHFSNAANEIARFKYIELAREQSQSLLNNIEFIKSLIHEEKKIAFARNLGRARRVSLQNTQKHYSFGSADDFKVIDFEKAIAIDEILRFIDYYARSAKSQTTESAVNKRIKNSQKMLEVLKESMQKGDLSYNTYTDSVIDLIVKQNEISDTRAVSEVNQLKENLTLLKEQREKLYESVRKGTVTEEILDHAQEVTEVDAIIKSVSNIVDRFSSENLTPLEKKKLLTRAVVYNQVGNSQTPPNFISIIQTALK